MKKIIAVHHRTGVTKSGEVRPTQVKVYAPGKTKNEMHLKLVGSDQEMWYVASVLPMAWRKPETDEDITLWRDHKGFDLVEFREWDPRPRKLASEIHPSQLISQKIGSEMRYLKAARVPASIDELIGPPDNSVFITTLGGSADAFVRMAHRFFTHQGLNIEIMRTPPVRVKNARTGPDDDMSSDCNVLYTLWRDGTADFYPLTERSLELLEVAIGWHRLSVVMRERIATGQRHDRVEKQKGYEVVPPNPGADPVNTLIVRALAARSADTTYSALVMEEDVRQKELVKRLRATDLWQEVFEPIKGVGPRIGARIIAAIGNIMRFYADTEARISQLRNEVRDILSEVDIKGVFPVVANWYLTKRCRQVAGVTRDQLEEQMGESLDLQWVIDEVSTVEDVLEIFQDIVSDHELSQLMEQLNRVRPLDQSDHMRTMLVTANYFAAIGEEGKADRLNRAIANKKLISRIKHIGTAAMTARKVASYAGLAPDIDRKTGIERFPRMRRGDGGISHLPLLRQAMYLLFASILKTSAEHSPWRKRYDEIRVELSERYPHIISMRDGLQLIARGVIKRLYHIGIHVTDEGLVIGSREDLLALIDCYTAEDGVDVIRAWAVERMKEAKVGKKMVQVFTKGHHLNMSRWRLLREFVDFMVEKWLDFEERQRRSEDRAA